MAQSLKLKTATIMVFEPHWAQFAVLARSQGISLSALLRQLVAREVRQAAREEAAQIAPASVAPVTRVRGAAKSLTSERFSHASNS